MQKALFIQKTRHLDFIDENILALLSINDAGFYNQISKWAKEGLLLKLTKGRYILAYSIKNPGISLEALACKIVFDAYVSHMSVLTQKRMVPEAAFGQQVTCITQRKTRSFLNDLGHFYYHHIKESAYCGFMIVEDTFGKSYKCATPTKALLDYLYFENPKINFNQKKDLILGQAVEYLENSLRLQNIKQIKPKELLSYQGKFSKKIDLWILAVREML